MTTRANQCHDAVPAAALDSAEGCAGDDSPGDALSDWSGLLCAATFTVAIVSAVVLQMTGCWSACMRWLEGVFA